MSRCFFLEVILFAIVCSTNFLVIEGKLSCTEKWKGPSENNTLDSCGLWDYFLKEYGIELIIPLILSAIVLLGGLVIFIGRYYLVCFGSFRRTPGYVWSGGDDNWHDATELEKNAHYLVHGVYITKASCVLVFIVAFIAAFINLHGFLTARRLVDPMLNYPALAREKYDKDIDAALKTFQPSLEWTDPNLNELYKSAMDQSEAVSLRSLPSFEYISRPYSFAFVVTTGWGYFFSLAPLLWFMACLVVAFTNERDMYPFLIMIGLWLWGALFWFLGFSGTLSNSFTMEFCSELYIYRLQDTGVFSWMLLPSCESKHASFQPNVLDVYSQSAAQIVCTNLRALCAGADLTTFPYSPCPASLPANDAQCAKDIKSAEATIKQMIVNTSVSSNICGPNVPNANCSIQMCANQCVSTTLRIVAARALRALSDGNTGLLQLTQTTSVMRSCSGMMDLVADTVLPVCIPLRQSYDYLRGGFYLYALACTAMFFVLMMGQKRFFSLKTLQHYSVAPRQLENWWSKTVQKQSLKRELQVKALDRSINQAAVRTNFGVKEANNVEPVAPLRVLL